jgi:hypothetical protein
MNVLDLIESELARASAPRASKKPVFLFLKDGEKATVRPLYNLPEMIVLAKHNKWSEQPSARVNAICAKEIGESCWHCEKSGASSDRKMQASNYFYLPVYVYSVIDTKTGKQITYKEKTDDGEVEKAVNGIRILELTSFGTISAVLTSFKNIYKDADYGNSILNNDFTIEQDGAGQQKKFTVIPKPAKPLDPRLKAATPTPDRIKELILAACPPLTGVSESSNGHVQAAVTIETGESEIPEF